MKIQQSEHDIQNVCISYLKAKGFYVFRMNAGMVENKYGGRIRLAPVGTPDIMAFKKYGTCGEDDCMCDDTAKLYFFEVKRPKGKVTFYQEQSMKELSEHGAICHVIHSLEELQEIV